MESSFRLGGGWIRSRGNLKILDAPTVGIIGSRHPSWYGRQQAFYFAQSLARLGVTVVSGGAIGIDTVALNGALTQSSAAVAVLGSGLNHTYPYGNKKLFQRIVEHGLLLSPFGDEVPPFKWNFPKRNHVIAALVDFLLIVEAGLPSGTMITAEAALDIGVDVGALPGCVDSQTSQGTLSLIKKGAHCITHPEDILPFLKSKVSYQCPTLGE